MSKGLAIAAVAGLAVGIAFILIFSTISYISNYRAVPTQSKITQEQAIDIAVHDATTKYLNNSKTIKVLTIDRHQGGLYIPVQNFAKEGNLVLPLLYVHPNGTYYEIDATTHEITKCYIPYCPLPEQDMKTIQGRLGWMVELVSRCDNFPIKGYDVVYVIDSLNGEIIWHGGIDIPKQLESC